MSKRNSFAAAAAIVALALASLHAAPAQATDHSSQKEELARCFGVNSCKGQSLCATAKHDCKGQNTCKGQGGCKSGDNGCAGKNDCKAKGGCATDKHDCKGKNDCKGKGQGGKNDCKGKGDCGTPK